MSEGNPGEFDVKMKPELMERLRAKLASSGSTLERWLEAQAEKFLEADEWVHEDFLRPIVEATPECIKVVRLDGTILEMNSAGLRMVGADSASDIQGTSIYELIAPEFRDEYRDFNQKVCAGERGVLRFDIIEKNGSRRHMESHAAPLASADGSVVQLALTRDITADREAEEMQRRNAETFATFVELSPLGIYVIDSEFRVARVSVGAQGAFQNVQPVIGRDFEEVMHAIWPDQLAKEIVDIFRHTLATGEAYASPGLTEKRKDIGTIESYQWQLIRVTLGDGTYGVVCYYFDATRLQEARLALEDSEERFRMLGENMSQLAWTCKELGKVEWYNQRWTNYTGLGFDELRDWGWKKVHHPDHIDHVLESINRSRESGEIWEDTFPLRGKDGEYRWFLSRAVPIRDEHGEIRRWFGTNTDVTELRETQQLLRDADRRKDEFLATLAHELRNPLAPIRTGLEVMKLARGKPEILDKVRSTMERQTLQLVSLVDDLLNVSRITQGKLELRKSRVDLVEIVENAIEASRSYIDEGGHQLTIDLPDQAIYIDADPNRMVQIVSNLLNNAAKYSSDGGRIRLSVEAAGGEVLLSVEDNGIGIPPDMVNRVFEMFAQIDRPAEQGYSGLGIGLSLVRSLVEMHGGTVEVHSGGIDEGSIFTVRLPAIEKPPIGAAVPPSREESGKSQKVLVVDDNEEAASMLRIAVELLGNEVRIASDGREAIGVAAEFLPAVILMDLGMPTMDGYESARLIRRQPWGKSILMIALTGWGLEEDRRKTKEAGFDHHLVKPADPAVLQELLNSAAGKNAERPTDHTGTAADLVCPESELTELTDNFFKT